MDDLLQHLELKIRDLIDHQIDLRHSNQQLQQSKSVIATEKATLLLKQQKAISQIESLVAKLKTIEKTS